MTSERAKHTDGPWSFDGPDDNIIVWGPGPEQRVCFLTSNGPARANAHLIAAAPDLLAGMKRLVRDYVSLLETGRDRIIGHGGSCDPVDVMEAGSPVLRSAKAIIAKAEGEPTP